MFDDYLLETNVHFNEAYQAIIQDPSFIHDHKTHVSHTILPLKIELFQQILIMCSRPKAGFTNDTFRHEARFLWATLHNYEFSLPTACLCAIKKLCGRLPYSTFIMRMIHAKRDNPL